MAKRKKNAFTLVEIITVIVMLGLFLMVTIPLISKAVLSVQLRYFRAQENSLLISGRNYFTEDRVRLPKIQWEKTTVTLRELIENGYLKKIVDNENNECDADQSYVEVTNVGKGEYQYYARLVCGQYDTELIIGNWSDWIAERPEDDGLIVESETFYNYKESTTFYSDWGDWTDVVGYQDDNVERLAQVIGTQSENRTVYRYRDWVEKGLASTPTLIQENNNVTYTDQTCNNEFSAYLSTHPNAYCEGAVATYTGGNVCQGGDVCQGGWDCVG